MIKMDPMEVMREFLINNGVTSEELDKVEEPKVINDLGKVLVVTLQNDNELGNLVMSLFFQVNDMAMLVMQLQNELEELKNA